MTTHCGKTAEFIHASLASAHLGHKLFDRVLAIDLPVFLRGNPVLKVAAAAAHLAPYGELRISSQPTGAGHRGR